MVKKRYRIKFKYYILFSTGHRDRLIGMYVSVKLAGEIFFRGWLGQVELLDVR